MHSYYRKYNNKHIKHIVNNIDKHDLFKIILNQRQHKMLNGKFVEKICIYGLTNTDT